MRAAHQTLCQGLCFSPDLYPPPRRVSDYGEMSCLPCFGRSETYVMLSSTNAETCQGMSKSGQLPWDWSRSINKGRNGLYDSHVSSHFIKYHTLALFFSNKHPFPKWQTGGTNFVCQKLNWQKCCQTVFPGFWCNGT